MNFHGFVSYDEVQHVTHNAALNLEVINIDPIIERNKKYGLSTKFADALACGTPFLLYAPVGMVETSIAKKTGCAFIVNDNKELADVLKKALFDAEAREAQVDRAVATSNTMFSVDVNVENFNKAIEVAKIR